MVASLSDVKIGERFSVGGGSDAATFPFLAKGCADPQTAYAQALAGTPEFVTNPNGRRLMRSQIEGESLTSTTPGYWSITVSYGSRESLDEQSFSIDFDVAGGTQKITQAIATVASYVPSGGTAVDYRGAIGVTKDGVEGCEIVVPAISFTKRCLLPGNLVTAGYIKGLTEIVGRTNSTEHMEFEAGRLLLAAVTGSRRGDEPWEMSYKFMAGAHRTDITIGQITGIAKNAWDYLDVIYEDAASEDGSAMIKRPKQVNVHQVYYSADFDGLLLPAGLAG